jgi:CheY-like chemotaxis protein
MVTILIVDDDLILHKVLGRILEISGFDVVSAYDGEQAIEAVRKMNPKLHLILMDHRMPIMSGIIATREITSFDNTIPIIFVSADESIKSEALAAGAKRFLTKPVRKETLIDAIGDVLRLNDQRKLQLQVN